MSSELRTQFLNYMTLQRFSNHTKRGYVSAIKGLAAYYNHSPDQLTNEQIQEYFRYLLEERQLSWETCNSYFSAFVCFYRKFLGWDEACFEVPPRPRSKKLPLILSEEEVKRLLDCAANLKHRVLLKTVYSAGLRVSEVVRLKPEHIESAPDRMLIRVEQGKGRKDRYTILSENLLSELRVYYRKYRPAKWLFPGNGKGKHLAETAASKAYHKAKKKPG